MDFLKEDLKDEFCVEAVEQAFCKCATLLSQNNFYPLGTEISDRTRRYAVKIFTSKKASESVNGRSKEV